MPGGKILNYLMPTKACSCHLVGNNHFSTISSTSSLAVFWAIWLKRNYQNTQRCLFIWLVANEIRLILGAYLGFCSKGSKILSFSDVTRYWSCFCMRSSVPLFSCTLGFPHPEVRVLFN